MYGYSITLKVFTKYAAISWLLLLPFYFFAQEPNKDSLLFELKNAKQDTLKCKILEGLIEVEYDDNIWPGYNDQLKKIVDTHLQLKEISTAEKKLMIKFKMDYLSNFGYLHMAHKGNSPKALMFFKESLKYAEEIGNEAGIAGAINNIAYVYKNQGDYSQAIEQYSRALKIYEKIGRKEGISMTLTNLGSVFFEQGDKESALKYMQRAIKINEELSNQNAIANSLNNIGTLYRARGEYLKAKECFDKALKIVIKQNDQLGIGSIYNNLGILYKENGDPECKSEKEACYVAALKKSLENFLKAIDAMKGSGDEHGLSNSYCNIAFVCKELKDEPKAIYYAGESMKIALKLGFPLTIQNSSHLLYLIEKKRLKWKEALEYFEMYQKMKDSIINENNTKAILKMQIQNEYDKQKTIDAANHEKELGISAEREKKQKVISFTIGIGLIFVLFLAIFIFNRLRVSNHQKKIIEEQKMIVEQQKILVEEKQKEIVDSITYAKRIQDAILPPFAVIKQYFSDSFVIYLPKDIVAGDFYWMEITDKHIFLAAADCTGHGVPGAMVSVVCHNALNRAVREYQLIDPALILNKTRELVIEQFAKNDADVKDGMDISLCVFSKNLTQLLWAGANNPLWIVSNNQMKEIKGDKQPIGMHTMQTNFTSHKIDLHKGDSIYIFTDGYQDQFGGDNGKKFKASRLKQTFLDIADKNMKEQENYISQRFIKWKGKLEQLDDVCVIGIKI